ncbi:MAG: hypothetical protein K8T25_05185 [Planctomycetia bacterium]|nr:hypothetical protein [Planctomycetia bacterium]
MIGSRDQQSTEVLHSKSSKIHKQGFEPDAAAEMLLPAAEKSTARELARKVCQIAAANSTVPAQFT